MRYHNGSVLRAADRALEWATSPWAARAAERMAAFEPEVDAFAVGFLRRTIFFLVPSPSPVAEAGFFFLTIFFLVVVGAFEVSPVAPVVVEAPPEAVSGPPAPGAGAPVFGVVLDGVDITAQLAWYRSRVNWWVSVG